MNIAGLDKAVVLAVLYNGTHQLGLGVLETNGKKQITVEQARVELQNNPKMYFDYLHGRVLKIDLSKDELSTSLYNRDNGIDAAENLLAVLKVKYANYMQG